MVATTRPLVLVLALCGMVLNPGAFAQIASPVNAGLNSGNNGFGSSSTSAATPNFSLGLLTLSAEKQQELEEVLKSILDQPQAEPLAPLLGQSPLRRGIDVASFTLAQGMVPASDDPQPAIQLAELTSQLTSSGLERAQANQLVSLIQNLVQKPDINQLSEAINLFNRIIKDATPEELASLRQNPAFVAISTTLRSARKALDS